MPQDPTLDDLDFDDPDDDAIDPAGNDLVKRLRAQYKAAAKKAKDVDDLRSKLADYERRDAVTAAGIKFSDNPKVKAKQMSALLGAHGDGEMTPEALLATAVDIGFAKPPEPDKGKEDALDAEDRIDAATAGAATPVKPDVLAELDPSKLSEEEFWAKAQQLGVAT